MNEQYNRDASSICSQSSLNKAPAIAFLLYALIGFAVLGSTAVLGQSNDQKNDSNNENQLKPSEKSVLSCDGDPNSLAAGNVRSRIELQLQPVATQRTLTCLTTAREVHDAWSREEALLVDVRRAGQYETFHIPGSLNLTAFSIKSKDFLKQKRIVLVNEGHHIRPLDDLCVELRSKGFHDVTVMEDGLYAWRRMGYSLNGDSIAMSKLGHLSPSELISSLSERDWRIIDLDRSLDLTERFLPERDVIRFEDGMRNVIKAVNHAQNQFKPNTLTGFLVVNRDGTDYSSVTNVLHLTEAEDVFYLSGGIIEFNRYLQTHSSLLRRLSQGFKEKHRCSG